MSNPTKNEIPINDVERITNTVNRIPADEDVKKALENKLDGATFTDVRVKLGIPEESKLEVEEGETFTKLLTEVLGKDNFNQLDNNQKYFLAVLELILEQKGLNAGRVLPGDRITLDFKSGNFRWTRNAEYIGGGELKLMDRTEAIRKTSSDLNALNEKLLKEGILTEALMAYKDNPSFEARKKYLEQADFCKLVNIYLKGANPSAKDISSENYKGTPEQNSAYLKAYLQFAGEYRKLSGSGTKPPLRALAEDDLTLRFPQEELVGNAGRPTIEVVAEGTVAEGTGAGETGAGETGAGETGAGETGAGETGAGDVNSQLEGILGLRPGSIGSNAPLDPNIFQVDEGSTAEGTPTTAEGTPTTAEGTPTTAEGTPTTAEGTPTTAEGTPTTAEETPSKPEEAHEKMSMEQELQEILQILKAHVGLSRISIEVLPSEVSLGSKEIKLTNPETNESITVNINVPEGATSYYDKGVTTTIERGDIKPYEVVRRESSSLSTGNAEAQLTEINKKAYEREKRDREWKEGWSSPATTLILAAEEIGATLNRVEPAWGNPNQVLATLELLAKEAHYTPKGVAEKLAEAQIALENPATLTAWEQALGKELANARMEKAKQLLNQTRFQPALGFGIPTTIKKNQLE